MFLGVGVLGFVVFLVLVEVVWFGENIVFVLFDFGVYEICIDCGIGS